MKRIREFCSAALCLLVLGGCLLVQTGAHAAGDGAGSDGWRTVGGKTCYYRDGAPVTKDLTIDGVRYAFTADGTCAGTYTGWTGDGRYHYYYVDGVRLTGWQKFGDKTRFFNRDGVMRTGWVAFQEDAHAYYFDEHGVWDENEYFSPAYRPETLRDFLLDFDYPADASYEIYMGKSIDYTPFGGIEKLKKLLADHADTPLVFGERPSDDEIYFPEGIYASANRDLTIHEIDEGGRVIAPQLSLSKDEKGRCFLYVQLHNFGIRLKDDTAYDTFLKYLRT